jgi:hypothetical protein
MTRSSPAIAERFSSVCYGGLVSAPSGRAIADWVVPQFRELYLRESSVRSNGEGELPISAPDENDEGDVDA